MKKIWRNLNNWLNKEFIIIIIATEKHKKRPNSNRILEFSRLTKSDKIILFGMSTRVSVIQG